MILDEEILWKTRARQHWLKEGDGNTKFFHATANGRRRANTITMVEDGGNIIHREEDKRNYFYSYFKGLFAPTDNDRTSIGDWSELFSDGPSLNHADLTLPFSMEEIKKATFQLGGDKAPGPDGFNLRFFQVFWEMIKTDLFNIFLDLFNGSLSSASLDYSYICLIPKKEGAKVANV